MKHIVAPLVEPSAWPIYAGWFADRGLLVPNLPDAGFIYALELQLEPRKPPARVPLAGVCLYLTKGQIVVVEHLATSPERLPRVLSVARAHHSIAYLTAAIRTYCCGAGKYPWALARHKGIRKALLREGWTLNPAGEFSHMPVLEDPASALLERQGFSSGRAPRATVRDVLAIEGDEFDVI
jgi:hypothetical protein